MLDLLKQTYNYQVDLVVPNTERTFDEIKDLFKRYFLLSKISLAELLSNEFCETFLTNGALYLHSFNTKLDCDSCCCLLPNGKLYLNIPKSLNEKIPVEFCKKSIKSFGYEKYEIQFCILDVRKDKKFELLKKIFETIEFSFYAYWETSSSTEPRDIFNKVFGSKRVLNCLNRIDSCVKSCSDDALNKYFYQSTYSADDWNDMENVLGCILNDIEIENQEQQNKSKRISILRVKGFIPNRLISIIVDDHLKPLIERELEYKRVIMNDDEKDFGRVFIKVHGFRDAIVSLVKLDNSLDQKMRTNEENFVGFCLDFKDDDISYNSIFKDFNKFYSVSCNE